MAGWLACLYMFDLFFVSEFLSKLLKKMLLDFIDSGMAQTSEIGKYIYGRRDCQKGQILLA